MSNSKQERFLNLVDKLPAPRASELLRVHGELVRAGFFISEVSRAGSVYYHCQQGVRYALRVSDHDAKRGSGWQSWRTIRYDRAGAAKRTRKVISLSIKKNKAD